MMACGAVLVEDGCYLAVEGYGGFGCANDNPQTGEVNNTNAKGEARDAFPVH
jgi:hypothetical protein